MKRAFRKISRGGSFIGGTKWYLSEDCLLAATSMVYVVKYRRFYLRDLESIMVWSGSSWLWRLTVPTVVLAVLGTSLWHWVNSTSGAIFSSLALGWAGLELALGPTAKARIRTMGATIDLPLVKRTRRAKKALAEIDAAVHATRSVLEQPATPASTPLPADSPTHTRPEASVTPAVAAGTQTNGS